MWQTQSKGEIHQVIGRNNGKWRTLKLLKTGRKDTLLLIALQE